MRLKVSSAKRRPFCLGLNVLMSWHPDQCSNPATESSCGVLAHICGPALTYQTLSPATVKWSRKGYHVLSHAPCWFSLLIGKRPWNMEPYLTFDVISVRYKDKRTSLMTSQWRFRPPSAFLTATVRPSYTVFIRWFRPDYCDSWDFKAAVTFQIVTNIVWAWDKFVTPCLLPRIQQFIHTYHRNTTLGLRPRVVLRCCVWINSRIRVSKQGVTNNNSRNNSLDHTHPSTITEMVIRGPFSNMDDL